MQERDMVDSLRQKLREAQDDMMFIRRFQGDSKRIDQAIEEKKREILDLKQQIRAEEAKRPPWEQ